MWYWFCPIASVTLVIGAVAAILWWAWRQETASRFADGLDHRFAKYRTEPQLHRHPEPLKAYLDWVNWRGELEQRVTALEKTWDVYHGETTRLKLSTDSLPDTETPAEQGSTKTLSYSELFPASQGGTPKP